MAGLNDRLQRVGVAREHVEPQSGVAGKSAEAAGSVPASTRSLEIISARYEGLAERFAAGNVAQVGGSVLGSLFSVLDCPVGRLV